MQRTPINIVSGFLGVGKTTALRHCLKQRPDGERWAVVVNEAGALGIDGAILQAQGQGTWVREIGGGCICCSSGPLLPVTLTRVLRELRPQRILLEPSGMAEPARVLDILHSDGLRAALQPMAVITLVDARQFGEPQWHNHAIYRDQLQIADILLANKADLASAAQLQWFEQQAAAMFPPKLLIGSVSHGRIEADYLNIDPRADAEFSPQSLAADVYPRQLPGLQRRAAVAPWRQLLGQGDGYHTCAWQMAPDIRFTYAHLLSLFARLPQLLAPAPLLRAKAVFHTERGWRLLQWAAGDVSDEAIAWRRDNRMEIIAGQAAAWAAVELQLHAAVHRD